MGADKDLPGDTEAEMELERTEWQLSLMPEAVPWSQAAWEGSWTNSSAY